MMSRSVFSNHGAVELLNERLQINVITEASAITTIQRSQVFFAESNVSSPPAIELPGPGFFISAASATGRHEEPANETSQLLSLSKPSCSVVKLSHSAGGPLWLKTRASITLVPACN